MADKRLDALLRELNRREHVGWLPEMSMGQAAFDHLVAALRTGSLEGSHTANVLRALTRLRQYSREGEFESALEAGLTDHRIEVRSAAATILAGLIGWKQMELSEDRASRFREALALGLYVDARKLVEETVTRR